MADQNRLIELTVNLKAAQATGTLNDMTAAAKELEQALRGAEKGAEGFSQATTTLSAARGELKEFRLEAKGITFEQQIASMANFAKGFIGGFAAMKGAVALFGDQTSEEMQKVEKTMVSLIAVLQGMSAIAQAFDARTITGLKGLGQSFMGLLKSVQTASLGMKAALVSTGIGAIAVAVGLIIANFDKIVKVSRELLGIDKDISKEAEARIKYQDQIIKLDEEQLKIAQEIDKLTGYHTEALEAQRKLLDENLKKAEAELVLAQEKEEKDNKHKDSLKFLQTAWVVILQSVGLTNKALEVQEGYLTKNGEKAKDSAQATKNIEDQILKDKQEQLIASEALTEQQIKLSSDMKLSREQEVALLGTQKENEIKIFELKKKILESSSEEKRTAIDLAVKKAEEIKSDKALYDNEQKRIQTMKDAKLVVDRQLAVITAQEIEYKRIQTIETYRKELQHDINMQLILEKEATQNISGALDYQLSVQTLLNDRLDKSVRITKEYQTLQAGLVDGIKAYWQEWHKVDDNLENADKKLEEFSTRIAPSDVRILNGAFEEMLGTLSKIGGVSKEAIGAALEEEYKLAKKNLDIATSEDVLKTKMGKEAVQELAVQQLFTRVINDRLTVEKLIAEKRLESNNKAIELNKQQQADLQAQFIAKGKLQAQDLAELKFLEDNGVKGKELQDARNASALKQEQLESDILAIQQEDNKVKMNGHTLDLEKEKTEAEINGITSEIKHNNEKLGDVNRETTAELKQQLKLVQQLANWYQKNQKYVEAGIEVLKAGLEIFAKTAENKVNTLQANYAQWKANSDADIKKLDDEQAAIDKRNESNQSALDNLLAEEGDADAARLAIIDQEIEKKQTAMELDKQAAKKIADAKYAASVEDVKRQNQIAVAQHEQQKRQKVVDLVNAVVNTALAVIKAAPNPVLMALSGIVGAAGIAVIASQKIPPAVLQPLPPKPATLAEGGPLVGPSHAGGGIDINAEGGEWIAPKWMVNNPRTAPVIDSLEAFRQSKPKFAEGGSVPSGVPASPATQAVTIDYDKMAQAFGKTPIYVSVREIRDANRKFANVVENKSSI